MRRDRRLQAQFVDGGSEVSETFSAVIHRIAVAHSDSRPPEPLKTWTRTSNTHHVCHVLNGRIVPAAAAIAFFNEFLSR